MLKKVLIFGLMLFLSTCSPPGIKKHKEAYYQKKWCKKMGGRVEVVLSGKVRCDCLLDDFAVEVDFAQKWAEAIGQALLYAKLTGRRPGILLICLKPRDFDKIALIEEISNFYNLDITIWVTDGR